MNAIASRPRSYRPAPDWLVYLSLAVTGLLYLSDRWQWFGFNEHKGWTVLIAVAAVGVGLLLMLVWFVAALSFRRRFQFGIRTLLMLTVAVALPFSWLANEMQQARRQHEAAIRLKELGGESSYSGYSSYEINNAGGTASFPPEVQPAPDWLMRLFGDDFFYDVLSVDLPESVQNPKAALELLHEFPYVTWIDIRGSGITDAHLENLPGLTELEGLVLDGTAVTGAGFAHLREFPALRTLGLARTYVTNSSLASLKDLNQLESIQLKGTEVGDAGLESLRNLHRLKWLGLAQTKVGDAGLGCLERLFNLEILLLDGTEVTDLGLADLRSLDRLQVLHVAGTRVTPDGERTLQKALPKCHIWCD